MTERNLNKLKQRFIEQVLERKVRPGRYADGGNLYCVVSTTHASWLFRYTANKKQRDITIASVRKLADLAGSDGLNKRAQASLNNARLKAAEYRFNLAKGKPLKAIIKNDYPTLDDIVDYYCKTKSVDRKTLNSHLSPFISIYKDKGPEFSKEMGVAYRDVLIRNKKSPNTIANYMRALQGIFSVYLSDHNIDFVNPLKGVIYKKDESAVNDRLPLPNGVIKKVYESLENDYRNLWLALVVTGARFNEIYGIKSKDLQDGFINIEGNDRRSLKNAASKRKIPLFINLPKRQREYYWDDMASVSACSQAFQRKINKHIPKEMIGTRKMTCHSLRHNITDFLRLKGVHQNIEDMFLGHAAKDTSNRVYGSVEGRKQALKEHLQPVIEEYKKFIGIDA